MRKFSYRPYVLLIFFLLSLMSLSKNSSESIRVAVICGLSPCWKGLNTMKEKMIEFFQLPFVGSENIHHDEELERLRHENRALRTQMKQVRQWLLNEARLDEQVEKLQLLKGEAAQHSQIKDFFVRRSQELSQRLELQMESMPAQIIFREPSSWSSAIWINVGARHNDRLGKRVVCKNSPVLAGSTLVGVIEYVGDTQSRVRLITDSSSSYSVRAIRGSEQDEYLLEHLDAVLLVLEMRKDLLFSDASIQEVLQSLKKLKTFFVRESGGHYFAKGELYGSGTPLWRSRDQILKGVGFNYDFSDQEGLARDLRTGKVYHSSSSQDPIDILREGDLLITTGLDGVLPVGLRVAVVSKVAQLKEGASSYEIEAVSTAGNLDELTQVFVLPPLEI